VNVIATIDLDHQLHRWRRKVDYVFPPDYDLPAKGDPKLPGAQRVPKPCLGFGRRSPIAPSTLLELEL
jgi:hypothetical protein